MSSDEDWSTTFTELHFAASVGDIGKVRELLATNNFAINAFDGGNTPLHYAAAKEHLDVVKMLLAAGADVNAQDPSVIGDTPLGAVAGNCSLELALLLVSAGADPALRGWMQVCALDHAKNRKRGDGPAVYRLLIRATRHLPREHREP